MSIKILSIGHSYVLSVNRKLPNEIARLTDGKWDITTIAPSHLYADYRDYAIEKQNVEMSNIEDISVFCKKNIHAMFYSPTKLGKVLDNNWNLIHAWEEPYIIAGCQIAAQKKSQTKLVYRTAQSYNKKYPFPFNFVERYSMSQASGWICSGQLVANTLKERAGYQLPMKLIPLGVDLDLFVPERTFGASIRTNLDWCDPSIPVIGYLGRLVPEKGIRQLMQIFDRLSTPCRILFIGSGYLKSEIEDWSHQFPDRVRVVTNATHTDIPQYLNMMDILVAPSQTAPNWREQFGRMLIEAMACGVPVIGSDSGEIPYTIGRAGLVVEESNIDKWVEAIENLLDSPEKRKELALLGLERVKHYSWENIARQYINFFTEILETKV